MTGRTCQTGKNRAPLPLCKKRRTFHALAAEKHDSPSPSHEGKPLALPSVKGEKRPGQTLQNFFSEKKGRLFAFFYQQIADAPAVVLRHNALFFCFLCRVRLGKSSTKIKNKRFFLFFTTGSYRCTFVSSMKRNGS